METKERILKAAWDLLERDESTTGGQAARSQVRPAVKMADIAKAAGISRQAVYLHYENRADLLVATTRYIDTEKNVDALLEASRTAQTGKERLRAFIPALGNYFPEIYRVMRALMDMAATDAEAAAAVDDRQNAMRHGCEAAIRDLKRDGDLATGLNAKQGTDLLWTLLSVHTWEQLTQTCGWSQKRYIETVTEMAEKMLVAS